MGLDQFFYEVGKDGSINEDNQIFYFRKNWDFHWDLERYFDIEIKRRQNVLRNGNSSVNS